MKIPFARMAAVWVPEYRRGSVSNRFVIYRESHRELRRIERAWGFDSDGLRLPKKLDEIAREEAERHMRDVAGPRYLNVSTNTEEDDDAEDDESTSTTNGACILLDHANDAKDQFAVERALHRFFVEIVGLEGIAPDVAMLEFDKVKEWHEIWGNETRANILRRSA